MQSSRQPQFFVGDNINNNNNFLVCLLYLVQYRMEEIVMKQCKLWTSGTRRSLACTFDDDFLCGYEESGLNLRLQRKQIYINGIES